MPKVTFVKEKQEIEVPAGSNLRDAARKAGIAVNYQLGSKCLGKINCLGHGTCGSCHVLVKKGMENLSPKGKWEKFRLAIPLSPLPTDCGWAAIGHEEESRLACQVQVNGDCTIETNPAFNWEGENFWQKPYPNK
jgi:ferredoxin